MTNPRIRILILGMKKGSKKAFNEVFGKKDGVSNRDKFISDDRYLITKAGLITNRESVSPGVRKKLVEEVRILCEREPEHLPFMKYYRLLERSLTDPDPQVVIKAIKATTSAAKSAKESGISLGPWFALPITFEAMLKKYKKGPVYDTLRSTLIEMGSKHLSRDKKLPLPKTIPAKKRRRYTALRG